MSHPTWVRGLKPYEQLNSRVYRLVAPYVGAWIEILFTNSIEGIIESHPTWVRGLKHVFYNHISRVHLSHPTWVRGLKFADTIELCGGGIS